MTLDPEGSQDRAEREIERLEDGTLLDVELEVRRRCLQLASSLERTVEVDVVLAQCVRKGDAVPVTKLAQLVLVGHRARGCARPEEAPAEARALLVCPVDEANRHLRGSFLGDPPDDLDAGHQVEGSVEPAAVRHRVDVAADQHRPLGASTQREPLVAGLVDLLLDSGSLELSGEPLARLLPRLGPRDPLRAVLVAGQLPELLQLRDRSLRVERHGRELTTGRIRVGKNH